MDSYFEANHLAARDGDVVACHEGGQVLARLRGYLIVPLERVPDVDAFMAGLLPEGGQPTS